MKINCAEKMIKALDFCKEQRDKELNQRVRSIHSIISKIDKVIESLEKNSKEREELEEASSWLAVIADEVRKEKYECTPGQSLPAVLMSTLRMEMASQVRSHEQNNSRLETEIQISSDFEEHCFLFGEHYFTGQLGMCGGIIFHGFPDIGYTENGSVMIDPQYGWHRHT